MYVIGESQRLRVARNGVVSLNTQNRLTPTVPNLNKLGIYGQDPNPLSGLILPVEALVATEIVQATISTQDRVTHIGGADMVRYMRNPQFQNRVLELAKAALTELGISHPDQIIYTVLNKNGGISGLKEESDRLSDRFGFPNFSQHDL
jgi:hypothetical protein